MSVAGNDMVEGSVAKVAAGIAMVHDDPSKLETGLDLGTGMTKTHGQPVDRAVEGYP